MAGYDRTEELFHAALQQSGDVVQFLERECGADKEMFEAVQSLVEAAAGQDRILDQPISIGSSIQNQMGAPQGPELQLNSGDIVHNYQIVRRLGKGGMGTVFLANELSPIQREVAIKLTNHQVDHPTTAARLANERQTLAALNHPRIPTIFNAGITADDHTYLVLEYVDGAPIIRHCRQQNVSLLERLELFTKLCDVVSYVHENGVVHRDLKSANVLVKQHDGRFEPFLVDFGIAKNQHSQAACEEPASPSQDTQHGDLLGTPGCMSPEQYLQGFSSADHRSDVYSLGLLLYRLLVDQSPFPASFTDRSTQLATLKSPPSPAALSKDDVSEWPKHLDEIAVRCIQLHPEDRFATVNDVKSAVEAVTHNLHQARTAPPVSFHTNRKNRSGLSLLLSCAALVLMAPAFSFLNQPPQTVVTPTPPVRMLATQETPPETDFQTVKVDVETFGQIAAILDKQGLLPQLPNRIVVTPTDDKEAGLTIAHHDQAESLPVTANTRSTPSPGEKQSG